MSPTMIHVDEQRELRFVYHGGEYVEVYSTRCDLNASERFAPVDKINVWDEVDDAPAIGCTAALRAEAELYVAT